MKQENKILINLIETIKFARKMKIEKIIFKEEVNDLLTIAIEDNKLLDKISKEYGACVFFVYPEVLAYKHKILEERIISIHSFVQPQIVITFD